MGGGRKLSDNEFFTILRENAGLYARTARAIEKQYNVPYTRQAVKDRAENHPDILDDIKQENLDIAEEGLHSLMRDKDKRIKKDAIFFYLKGPGKNRGYAERHEKQQIGTDKVEIVFTEDKKWLK